jgi:hypothetical protein
VAHGGREQVGAAPAQRHRLLLVQLGPLAPHRSRSSPPIGRPTDRTIRGKRWAETSLKPSRSRRAAA